MVDPSHSVDPSYSHVALSTSLQQLVYMHRKLLPSSAPDAQSDRQEGSRGLLCFVEVHLQSASSLSGQHLWYALVVRSLRAVPLLHALPSCNLSPEPGAEGRTSHVAHRMAQAAQAARLADLATLTREDLRCFLLGAALAAAARLCCSTLAWAGHPNADVKVDHSDCVLRGRLRRQRVIHTPCQRCDTFHDGPSKR